MDGKGMGRSVMGEKPVLSFLWLKYVITNQISQIVSADDCATAAQIV
jgi:hypothetical protein